ncbi:MAG: bifunctional diaminohydroxyphosphoribosylaminopyrimidine deaminase/5-amino-6-(5-phosphoribosylamino)uracil reductase RibD [Chitinophagaceae bacterium]|nr:bifunctional diaminohydroxyphosphoribosylaminopyrimidine deaminase/5-amino-6-(5-phosphoribosylamino)uracil reductase RibD [Chitinophagaceae bacterium]
MNPLMNQQEPRSESITRESAASWMRHALNLARLGAGNVAPNPMVGAVLVAGERIIGEGFHRQYGGPHAEVDCMNAVKEEDRHLISSADLFVTLEPCAHFGKTPPCADLIIRHQIPRVWIGCRDPFPQVDGKGIEKLEKAGVKVTTGILEQECRDINRRFFCFHTQKRPYIFLKWAQTADGFIAPEQQSETNERLLISNEWSNRIVHRWRTEEAAILVGWKTALVDNPQLTTRHWPGKQPLRILIDRNLQVPDNYNLFHSFPTLVYNAVKSEKRKRYGMDKMGRR